MSASASGETWPVAATSSSCWPYTLRILEDRPTGQKDTSKPPPDGMMNVDVWSSKATMQSVSDQVDNDQVRANHSCMRPGTPSSPLYCTNSACNFLGYRSFQYSSLKGGCTLRRRNNRGQKLAAVCCHLGMGRRHLQAWRAHSPASPTDTSLRHLMRLQIVQEELETMSSCRQSFPSNLKLTLLTLAGLPFQCR